MNPLVSTPLNYLHFYEADRNEEPFWQPISVSEYMPISFVSKIGIPVTNLKLVVCDGKEDILTVSMTSRTIGGSVYIFVPVTDSVLLSLVGLNLNSRINHKLTFKLNYRAFSNTTFKTLLVAYAEVKSYDWLKENCILLSAQFKGSKFNTLGVLDEIPVSWHMWFPGEVSDIDSVIEDNSFSFRDQAWGNPLVSRKINKVYKVKIGDARGVPFWMYESVQTFISLKNLYLNDTIKVNISEGEKPSFKTVSKYNKGFIEIGLTAIELLPSLGATQIEGTEVFRDEFSFQLATDQLTKQQNLFGKQFFELSIPNRVLAYGGSQLQLKLYYYYYNSILDNNSEEFIVQSDKKVTSNIIGNYFYLSFLDRVGVDYVIENVYSGLEFRTYQSMRDTVVKFYYSFTGDMAFIPYGIGLLYDPQLFELTVKKYDTPVWLGFALGSDFQPGNTEFQNFIGLPKEASSSPISSLKVIVKNTGISEIVPIEVLSDRLVRTVPFNLDVIYGNSYIQDLQNRFLSLINIEVGPIVPIVSQNDELIVSQNDELIVSQRGGIVINGVLQLITIDSIYLRSKEA